MYMKTNPSANFCFHNCQRPRGGDKSTPCTVCIFSFIPCHYYYYFFSIRYTQTYSWQHLKCILSRCRCLVFMMNGRADVSLVKSYGSLSLSSLSSLLAKLDARPVLCKSKQNKTCGSRELCVRVGKEDIVWGVLQINILQHHNSDLINSFKLILRVKQFCIPLNSVTSLKLHSITSSKYISQLRGVIICHYKHSLNRDAHKSLITSQSQVSEEQKQVHEVSNDLIILKLIAVLNTIIMYSAYQILDHYLG